MRYALARPALAALLIPLLALVLGACSTLPPAGVEVVSPFAVDRYLGKWYEIARLDHRFERGLSDVNATYRRLPDGGIEVVNRGYDTARGQWREAVGHARFNGDPAVASLKVSFFGPFYGGYHVVALDREHYRWAMVLGPDTGYFWILARDRQLPAEVRERLLAQARSLGVEVDKLIWVEHGRDDS